MYIYIYNLNTNRSQRNEIAFQGTHKDSRIMYNDGGENRAKVQGNTFNALDVVMFNSSLMSQ